jgi:hypothetical protein
MHPEISICQKATKRVQMTLVHRVDANGVCEVCGFDVILDVASKRCSCSATTLEYDHRHNRWECQHGVTWYWYNDCCYMPRSVTENTRRQLLVELGIVIAPATVSS